MDRAPPAYYLKRGLTICILYHLILFIGVFTDQAFNVILAHQAYIVKYQQKVLVWLFHLKGFLQQQFSVRHLAVQCPLVTVGLSSSSWCFSVSISCLLHAICTVTGPSVIDFYGQLDYVRDRCVYSLLEITPISNFRLLAKFQERRRKDVSFLDSVKLQLNNVSFHLKQGGRVLVSQSGVWS